MVGTGPVVVGAVVAGAGVVGAVVTLSVGWSDGVVTGGSPGEVVTTAVVPGAAAAVVGVEVVCVDPQPARTTAEPTRTMSSASYHPPMSQSRLLDTALILPDCTLRRRPPSAVGSDNLSRPQRTRRRRRARSPVRLRSWVASGDGPRAAGSADHGTPGRGHPAEFTPPWPSAARRSWSPSQVPARPPVVPAPPPGGALVGGSTIVVLEPRRVAAPPPAAWRSCSVKRSARQWVRDPRRPPDRARHPGGSGDRRDPRPTTPTTRSWRGPAWWYSTSSANDTSRRTWAWPSPSIRATACAPICGYW